MRVKNQIIGTEQTGYTDHSCMIKRNNKKRKSHSMLFVFLRDTHNFMKKMREILNEILFDISNMNQGVVDLRVSWVTSQL